MADWDASEVKANLDKLIAGLDATLIPLMEKACYMVEGQAKKNCPVDDGLLRASISHDVDAKADIIEGIIGTNLEYAPYVHQGTGIYAEGGNGRTAVPWHYKDPEGNWHSTKGQKPNPFLQKAVDENKAEILRIFQEALGNDN